MYREKQFFLSFYFRELQMVSRAIDLLREKMKEQNGDAAMEREKEGNWDRGGRKKRNRDITFARYRLIGITRFSMVFERVPAGLTFHSPFVAYYPFVTSQDKRLRRVQSSGVGCNYGLLITNSTRAVTTCPELTRSLLMHWRDKFTPQVSSAAFLSLELIRIFFPLSHPLSLPLFLSVCFVFV